MFDARALLRVGEVVVVLLSASSVYASAPGGSSGLKQPEPTAETTKRGKAAESSKAQGQATNSQQAKPAANGGAKK